MADLTDDEFERVRKNVGNLGFASVSVYQRIIELTLNRPVTIEETTRALDRIREYDRQSWTDEERAAYDAEPKIKDITRSETAWRWHP